MKRSMLSLCLLTNLVFAPGCAEHESSVDDGSDLADEDDLATGCVLRNLSFEPDGSVIDEIELVRTSPGDDPDDPTIEATLDMKDTDVDVHGFQISVGLIKDEPGSLRVSYQNPANRIAMVTTIGFTAASPRQATFDFMPLNADDGPASTAMLVCCRTPSGECPLP